MGKTKNDSTANDEEVVKEEELSHEDKLKYCNSISKPMASKKLSKKCYKLIKKAMKHKTYVRNGLKDVQKVIRKGETGIVVFAGDITPVDIMCHLPGVCEDKSIPYVYVPSKKDLGGALGIKKGCLMVLVKYNDEYKDAYEECKSEITNLPIVM